MNDQLANIHTELLQMKEELESRLFEYSFFQQDSPTINSYQQATLMYHVKEELQDVLLALSKIENGTYGICEETGQAIPLAKLAVLPTARTANDFLYHIQFEKKTLPIWAETDETYSQALFS
ncbi:MULTISPECIES: TraR/DksA family transcriptional regulator [Bacillus]|uniref:TraR/DksA family transcriptional regulator n=1 Tax=Bacillus TaxID=1386 RepID=UPI00047E1266|nr:MULTISPECIES: TraR/DksA family transcriptional regulator [Bacillus]QHZ49065.1 TraR/DksA family transcriptional regulator [Bacillus sp. NSP9.1]WFA07407.1 TraR/DksA family transcriptional regulator [Bacillus sp. HSf4]